MSDVYFRVVFSILKALRVQLFQNVSLSSIITYIKANADFILSYSNQIPQCVLMDNRYDFTKEENKRKVVLRHM